MAALYAFQKSPHVAWPIPTRPRFGDQLQRARMLSFMACTCKFTPITCLRHLRPPDYPTRAGQLPRARDSPNCNSAAEWGRSFESETLQTNAGRIHEPWWKSGLIGVPQQNSWPCQERKANKFLEIGFLGKKQLCFIMGWISHITVSP